MHCAQPTRLSVPPCLARMARRLGLGRSPPPLFFGTPPCD
jgi:hypothetical protein